jgi:hypothetical protein
MTRPLYEPFTMAHELVAFHPGISVVRGDTGDMRVFSDHDTHPYRGAQLGITLALLDNIPAGALQIRTESASPTTLLVPRLGGLAERRVVTLGDLSVEDTISLARKGVDVFDGLQQLPEGERALWAGMPRGNSKAYDYMRQPMVLHRESFDAGMCLDAIPEEGLTMDAFRYARELLMPRLPVGA